MKDDAVDLVRVLTTLLLILELGYLDIMLLQHFSHLLFILYIHCGALLSFSYLHG